MYGLVTPDEIGIDVPAKKPTGFLSSSWCILDELLPRWGIETVFVDGDDLDAWEQALAPGAAVVFFETPSNPMQGLVDIAAVSQLAHDVGAVVIVDNVFATPVLQKPLAVCDEHSVAPDDKRATSPRALASRRAAPRCASRRDGYSPS